MALQSSGAISLLDIAGEFGGGQPHSISEYYGAASGVPSSGAIDFADFYGKSAAAANIQGVYAGSVADTHTSVGIFWTFRNKLTGTSTAPSRGGYVTLTGTGTFPAVYAGTSGAADAYLLDFSDRAYVGLAGQFASTHNGAGWTKLGLDADGRPNEYMLYASGLPISGNTEVQDYVAGVDSGSLAATIDWYNA